MRRRRRRRRREEWMGSGCRFLALSALKIRPTLLLCCPEHAPQFAFRRLLLLSLSVSFSLPVYPFPCFVLAPSLSLSLTPGETLIPPGARLYPGGHTLSSALSSKDSEISDELTHGCGARERRRRTRRRSREGGLELKL